MLLIAEFGDVEALAVEREVHHVRLHQALHRVVQADPVWLRDVPGLHLAAADAAHVHMRFVGRLAQVPRQAAGAKVGAFS